MNTTNAKKALAAEERRQYAEWVARNHWALEPVHERVSDGDIDRMRHRWGHITKYVVLVGNETFGPYDTIAQCEYEAEQWGGFIIPLHGADVGYKRYSTKRNYRRVSK